MADLTLQDRVAVTEFTIAPWAPGQHNVDLIYRPALTAAGPTQTGWGGTVKLAPRTGGDGDWTTADRELVALRGRMRGNRHRLRLPLPPSFAGAPPPNGATATLVSARLHGETVAVTVTPSGWGSWTPTAGSYINIGDALYLIDEYVAGGVLRLVPGVIPLALRRPRGIIPTTGGGNPSNLETRGMGQFRGSLYTADINPRGGGGSIYWVDVASGTRREVVDPANNVRSLGTAFGQLYGNVATRGGTAIVRVNVPLADPQRNSLVTVLEMTGLPPTRAQNRLRGMAEWQAPDDDGPKLYAATPTALYRSTRPLPPVRTTVAFTDFFEEVTVTTPFTTVTGMSAGPNPGDPLYILDSGVGTGKIITWDGTALADFAEGTVGATDGPNVLRLADCQALEWYRGDLYVGTDGRGTTEAALARINWDTPTTAADISFSDPFVWARLSGGPSGPVGRHFPPTTFTWTEVPTQ